MWPMQGVWGLLALFCSGALVGRARSFISDDVISASACNASYNLTLLSNLTVSEAIEQRRLEAELGSVPLTIAKGIEAVLRSSREDTAGMLGLDVGCLDYLEFSLSEVALLLLNTTDHNSVSFEEVFRVVFTPKIEEVLKSMKVVKAVLLVNGFRENETVLEIAAKFNISLKTMTLLDAFDAALNGTDLNQTNLIPRSSFELLTYTTSQIAVIMAVEEERLLNYSLFHMIRVSLAGVNFINQLRITVSTARTVLRVTLVEMAERNDVLLNETTILKLIEETVPERLRYALPFVLVVGSADLALLNISLGDLGELVNKTVTELEGYEVYPRLIVFIVQARRELVRINRQTRQEVDEAFHTILTSYNITIVELSVEFNLTELQLMQMNLLQVERLCARFTLIRYANNLNVSLAEVAVKVNRSEEQLLNNLTVEEFQLVIRRLFVVRAFETMSQILGVGDVFLKNMLNIRVPLATLSVCQLDGFLTTTRRTVLGLKETVRERKLSFLVQINGFTIVQVYKFTLARFITHILRLEITSLFRTIDVSITDNHRSILSKYDLSDVERIFRINGLITNYRFSIFQLSWSYIVQKIIVLDEEDIEECERNLDECVGNAECINIPGSYECRCPPGGWSGRRCSDINECREGLDTCPSMSSICVNTPGSYRCDCRRGFRFNHTSNSCEDINECKSFFTNLCFWRRLECENSMGSYECRCPQGYRSGSSLATCLEIDECREGLDTCPSMPGICINTPGSYRCDCRRGFRFNHTSNSCEDVDECSSNSAVCPSNSKCMNTDGSFSCLCLPGYERDDDDDDDDDDDSGGQNVAGCRAKRFTIIIEIRIRLITVRRTPVFVSGGFPYFGQLYKRIYIYRNGLIAIGSPYYRAAPRQLTSLRRNVLAVFWANTLVSRRTQINYQEADRSTVELSEQLDNISSTVMNCSGVPMFRATWMLIVTWKKVAPAGFGGEQSTYQATLVTNGTSSYAIYNYQDGGMRWRRRLRRHCAVGYSTVNGVDSFQDDRSFTDQILRIDSEEIVDAAGNKRRGVMCHSLNKPDEPVTLTSEQRCLAWYNQEPDPAQWMGDLGDCPSTRIIARRMRFSRRGTRSYNIVCYEPRFPNRNGAGQQCCYHRRGRKRNAFVSEAPLAGRVYRYHFTQIALRETHDIEPFEVCCGEQPSTLCSLFYEKRPLTTAENTNAFTLPCSCRFLAGGCFRRSCTPRRTPRRRRFGLFRAWAFGDPHINTLDGHSYTFNGLGDYILVRSLDESHHLHGRTARPINSNGTLANATVFSGFAVKTNESDIAQILYNESVAGNLSITVITTRNGSCQPFILDDFDEARSFNEMSIERSDFNNHTLVVSFPSGFSIEVTPGVGLLQLAVTVSQELENTTQGLWGTFNRDKTDDFQYPNGSQLSINATEEEIFHFGQTWKVPDAEKMFVFPDCVLQDVFFDGAFRPAFLNVSGLSPEIITLCGGNRECLYDASQTGNLVIAAQTAQFEQENQQIQEQLENLPPKIMAPAEINVVLNQTIEFQVSATDPNNDTVTLDIEEPPPGANFDNTTGEFSWLARNASNVTLQFVAIDSKEASTVFMVIINLCLCQNNAECDFTEFVGDSVGTLRVVGCNCSAGYSGTFCENELLDPCVDEPCFDNVTCAMRNDTFGFICGPCPEGLTGDGENCYEFDECANTSLSGCNQTCVNTFGSFYCECRDGYAPLQDGKICEDINECQDASSPHNCTQNASCTNLPGTFDCTCDPGFQGDPYSSCMDINECENAVLCSQQCNNTEGSFFCSCSAGFKIGDDRETCEDIDECMLETDNCEQPARCENVLGSFICECPDGFDLSPDNISCTVTPSSACDNTNGGCSDTCVNSSGIITCYCPVGYNLTSDNKTCQDIDECDAGNGGCTQQCTNNDGGYSCSCFSGYQSSSSDGKYCEDVNECSSADLNNCNQGCENKNGSFQCLCEDGYQLQPDGGTCLDINECSSEPSLCGDATCTNVDGSFRCDCERPLLYNQEKCQGVRVFLFTVTLLQLNGKPVVWHSSLRNQSSRLFVKLAEGVQNQVNLFFFNVEKSFIQCRVISFRNGSVIAQLALNFDKTATNITQEIIMTALPQSGVIGNLTFSQQSAKVSDLDECTEAIHDCHEKAICSNKPGTFECKCKDGYQGDGKNSCEPVPEEKDNDSDDDRNKTLAIILGIVFGLLVIFIFVLLLYILRRNRNRENNKKDGRGRLGSRASSSNVAFPMAEKSKTGYYNVTPAATASDNLSGDYDYPDPQPDGSRNSHYDNPGLEKETGASRAVDDDPQHRGKQDAKYAYIDL